MRRIGRPFRRSEATTVVEGPPEPPLVEEAEVAPPPPPPPPPPRRPLIWPWLLLLLLLVAAGLAAAWWFTRDDDGNGRSTVNVPNVVSLNAREAVARLDDRGLIARLVRRASSAARGTVTEQDPGPGADVLRRSVVTLTVSSKQTVAVPDVVGDRVGAATRALRAKGFEVLVTKVVSNKAAGTVLTQSPAAGATASRGSTVNIRTSRGLVTVPDVVGRSRDKALQTIRGAGLEPKAFVVPSTQKTGTVVAQTPKAGKRVPGGTSVRLNLSNGQPGAAPPPPPPPPPGGTTKPATVTVPDVTGEGQASAQRLLNRTGLKAGVVYVPSDEPQGTVVSEAPAAGTTQKRGTRVQLNVALGPNPGPQRLVPDVVGETPAAAKARLENAGFKVQALPQGVTDAGQIGVVVDEQPAGGRRAPAGSTVTIYVGRAA